MKLKRKVATALLVALTILSICPAKVASATEVNSYTYNYDFWGIEYESPDAYTPVSYVDGKTLGTTSMSAPDSLYARDNRLFVVDTGRNRILELLVTDGELSLTREILEVKDDELEVKTLNGPMDIFQTENGDLYIADTANHRILHTNYDLEVIKVIYRPVSPSVDQGIDFEPTKLVVDRAGRVFCLARNVNRGLMQFEASGEFIGFLGANEVVFSMADKIKKMLSTRAQREKMADFVPVEYNNIYIDDLAFVYSTSDNFKTEEADAGTAKPIRKLNALGKDILIRNGEYFPMGDLQWGDSSNKYGPSRIEDITAFDDGTYYVVDRIRGRIFGYDEQGHLLYAFGGPGHKLGYHVNPTSIEHVGTDLYVLDSVTGGITRYVRTEFGDLIHSALDEYSVGNYEKSAEYWKEVLARNGNYELAYIGIGRSLLRQEDYEGAMEYFEAKRDNDNYSRAWKYYRKDWIENNMGYVIIVLVVLFLIPGVVKRIKKMRWEAREQYEYELKQKNK